MGEGLSAAELELLTQDYINDKKTGRLIKALMFETYLIDALKHKPKLRLLNSEDLNSCMVKSNYMRD